MFKTEEIFKEALGKAKEEEVKLENIMCSVKECRVCIKKKIQEAGNN